MPKPVSVLVLDDDRDFLSAIARVFSSEPYAIVTTTHPFEALSILAQGTIKVVVSDERMPVVSGAGFLQEVRKNFPGVVRILMTGHADMRSTEEAVNKGRVFALFSKPCNPDVLISAVRRGIETFDWAVEEQWITKSLRAEKPELIEDLAGAKGDLGHLAAGNAGPLSPGQQHLVSRIADRVARVLRSLESL